MANTTSLKCYGTNFCEVWAYSCNQNRIGSSLNLAKNEKCVDTASHENYK